MKKMRWFGLCICILLIISVLSSVVYSGEYEASFGKLRGSTLANGPTIWGPSLGKPGQQLCYNVVGVDPWGFDVCYCIDWGEGGYLECGNYYPSGTTETRCHVWDSSGTYNLKAFMRYKSSGETSGPSNTIKVTISNPPNRPAKPSGPTLGAPGISYSYSTYATDSDGDRVKFGWDWNGDGTIDEVTGYYNSGETCTISHIWNVADDYVVQVKAQDVPGLESSWSLSIPVIISDNTKPMKPERPTGPAIGTTAVKYTYSTVSTDPDGDPLYYKWDWGDGIMSEWNGPYISGVTASMDHEWTGGEIRTCPIKVIAKDDPNGDGDHSDGLESEWSESLPVTNQKRITTNPLLNLIKELINFLKQNLINKNVYTVFGTVYKYPEGTPVAGARVELYVLTIKVAEYTTDNDGNYIFTEGVKNMGNVKAFKEGFQCHRQSFDFNENETVQEVDLWIAPPGSGKIYGCVKALFGRPIENAQVCLYRFEIEGGHPRRISKFTETSADGYYEFTQLDIPLDWGTPGGYRLDITKEGYPTFISLPISLGSDGNFVIEKNFRLLGIEQSNAIDNVLSILSILQDRFPSLIHYLS